MHNIYTRYTLQLRADTMHILLWKRYDKTRKFQKHKPASSVRLYYHYFTARGLRKTVERKKTERGL